MDVQTKGAAMNKQIALGSTEKLRQNECVAEEIFSWLEQYPIQTCWDNYILQIPLNEKPLAPYVVWKELARQAIVEIVQKHAKIYEYEDNDM